MTYLQHLGLSSSHLCTLWIFSHVALWHIHTHVHTHTHLTPYLFNDTIRSLLRRLRTSLSRYKSTLAWRLHDSTTQRNTLLKYKYGITICFFYALKSCLHFRTEHWKVANFNKMTLSLWNTLNWWKFPKFNEKTTHFALGIAKYSYIIIHNAFIEACWWIILKSCISLWQSFKLRHFLLK